MDQLPAKAREHAHRLVQGALSSGLQLGPRWHNDQPLPAPIAVGSQNYPGSADQTRPIAMVLGTVDPNCSVPMLYDFLRTTIGNAATVVVGGDHSLNVSAGTDAVFQARNAANVDAGTAAAVHWINLI